MFQARPTDKRYVTGGGGRASVTLCDKGRGSKLAKKALRNSWTAPNHEIGLGIGIWALHISAHVAALKQIVCTPCPPYNKSKGPAIDAFSLMREYLVTRSLFAIRIYDPTRPTVQKQNWQYRIPCTRVPIAGHKKLSGQIGSHIAFIIIVL